MTSRERVISTLLFKHPDKIPIDIWCLESARIKHGIVLKNLLEKHETDFARVGCSLDRGYYGEYKKVGLYSDLWGSTWKMLVAGITGEVIKPAITDITKVENFRPPYKKLENDWLNDRKFISKKIDEHHRNGKFVIGGTIEVFQRMQWVRGSENLFCDLGLKEPGVFLLCDILTDYYSRYLDFWLETEIDAVGFTEDWGTQISLLISPSLWRSVFYPVYKKLFLKIKSANKFIFFHSDGYIIDIYPDLIELGANAINSQIWCMGVNKLAGIGAGRVTFWGELDRQGFLPRGTPQDIYNGANLMKNLLSINGGGLIGQGEIGPDVPLANIKAMLECWN